MIAAAFETSTRSASVAVGISGPDGALQIDLGALDSGRAHASDLLPLLHGLLNEKDLAPADLDAIVVGIGPGSYTGLRVGVATALGLVLGELNGKTPDLRGVPSCEALMAAELGIGEPGIWIQDARSGGFYVAEGLGGSPFQLVSDPEVLDGDSLEDWVLKRQGRRVFGDASTTETLAKMGINCAMEHKAPQASAVLDLGLQRLEELGPTPPGELAPLYLRPFAVKVRKR